jgi:hypothetical protein
MPVPRRDRIEQQTVPSLRLWQLADWEPAYAVAGINSYFSLQLRPGRYRVSTVIRHPATTMGCLAVLPDMARWCVLLMERGWELT